MKKSSFLLLAAIASIAASAVLVAMHLDAVGPAAPQDVGLVGDGSISHRVKPGDTLYRLSETYYGKPNMWQLIADANGIAGAADLKAGQVLRIPPARAIAVPAPASPTVTADNPLSAPPGIDNDANLAVVNLARPAGRAPAIAIFSKVSDGVSIRVIAPEGDTWKPLFERVVAPDGANFSFAFGRDFDNDGADELYTVWKDAQGSSLTRIVAPGRDGVMRLVAVVPNDPIAIAYERGDLAADNG